MNGSSDYRAKILFIEEDDDVRPLMRRMLQDLGYRLSIAIDEADALERARDGNNDADLILVNMVGVTVNEALDVARRVRGEADGNPPIIVIAEDYGNVMEGTDVQFGEREYVTYLEDSKQLQSLLARLLRNHDSAV